MNQQIAQLQDSDPEFARTLKRLRAASYGLAAAIILAAALGLWAVVVNSEQATQITKIQKTPCTLNPEGKACSTIKERIARHGSLKNPCIEHQRVEGTKGRNCPHFYVPPSQRQLQAKPESIQGSQQGGEDQPAPSPAGSPGGASPPKTGSHKAPAPQHPGSKAPPAPPSPGSSGEQSPVAPAPSSDVASEGTGANFSPENLPPASGPVKSTLEQTGETIHSIVCSLPSPLPCPEGGLLK